MDLPALFAGSEDDLADQGAERAGGLVLDVGMVERLGETLDLAAVGVGHVGMDGGNRLRGFGKACADLSFLAL